MNTSIIFYQYFPIYIFLLVALIIALVIFILSYFIGPFLPDSEKVSSYECGFDPFGNARNKFDVKFYLVAILFIIFDLEVTFLFPWAMALSEITFFGFWSMIIFLIILTIGFIYEWKKGALEWE